MTYAPDTIKEVRVFLKAEDADLDDVELGIVGGPSHILTGTSYHLGADQLIMSKNPYSARTVRDRAGLSNAGSALDIDDDLDELRELSVWLVAQCRADAPDTRDIREITYSPDGINVYTWDREKGVTSLPEKRGDSSHRGHSHISWYRDSEHRDKVSLFKRFYAQRSSTKGHSDMLLIRTEDNPTVYRSDGLQYEPLGPDEPPGTALNALRAAEAAGHTLITVVNMAELEAIAGRPVGEPVPAPPVDVTELAAALAPLLPKPPTAAEMEAAAEAAVRRVLGAVDGATPAAQ